MLQINLGDIATRVVRGLGIRGRVPFGLDENVVPIALLHDLTDSLYSQNPATFIAALGMPGGVANFSFACIAATTAGNAPIQDLVVKIDQMILVDVSTTAPTTPVLWYVNRGGGSPAGASVGAVEGILNQPFSPASGHLAQRMRSFVSTGTPAGDPGAGATQLGTMFLTQNSVAPFVIPLGVVLFPGDSFIVRYAPEAATVNRLVTIYGREFSRG